MYSADTTITSAKGIYLNLDFFLQFLWYPKHFKNPRKNKKKHVTRNVSEEKKINLHIQKFELH